MPARTADATSQPGRRGDQNATPSTQAIAVGELTAVVSAPKARTQLLPPKPKELERTKGRDSGAASTWIWGPQAGSSTVVFSMPGVQPLSRVARLIAASRKPAAPSAWPVQPLVELAWVDAGNIPATTAASTSSLRALAVPCRLM